MSVSFMDSNIIELISLSVIKLDHLTSVLLFSRSQEKLLLSSLFFIIKTNYMQNFSIDIFTSSCPAFELFIANDLKYFLMSLCLAIHEMLYPIRHQISFKQHISNKSHKYGLLSESRKYTSFVFTYKTTPYAGKPANEDGPY